MKEIIITIYSYYLLKCKCGKYHIINNENLWKFEKIIDNKPMQKF